MTVEDASRLYSVRGLDPKFLKDQEPAFQTCLSFFSGLEKATGDNSRHTSYGLKHAAENPSGRWGIPASRDCYNGHVYEGTLILAALASGFAMKQRGNYLKATFNISERGLRNRAREFAESRSMHG